MKILSKKIFCYTLIGLLTFSCVSSAYYKSSYAMEYVGGALAFEEALKWILACLGITATAGMTDAYWDSYGDDFVDYAIENGCTQQQIAEWQMKACKGIIDKSSDVWASFKAWANNLIGNNSGSSGLGSSDSLENVSNELLSYINTSSTLDFRGYNNTVIYSAIMVDFGYDGRYRIFAFPETGSYSIKYDNSAYGYYVFKDNSRYYGNIYNTDSSGNTNYFKYGTANVSFSASDYLTLYNFAYPDNFNRVTEIGSSGSVADENFDSVTNDVSALDVISSVLPDENSTEVSIPMPGLADSDNETSADAYDEIIDSINNGEITIEKGIEDIQAILRIITYDVVSDDVIPIQPDPDTGGNKKKEDEIAENKNNMSFTLAGLENVFPFCIPWDIYAFMTLLVAEPVAPEFDYPIQSVNNRVEVIHIDLSPFEPVAVVVRYIFDFLFIVGLAMLTRSLIGGGGSE